MFSYVVVLATATGDSLSHPPSAHHHHHCSRFPGRCASCTVLAALLPLWHFSSCPGVFLIDSNRSRVDRCGADKWEKKMWIQVFHPFKSCPAVLKWLLFMCLFFSEQNKKKDNQNPLRLFWFIGWNSTEQSTVFSALRGASHVVPMDRISKVKFIFSLWSCFLS